LCVRPRCLCTVAQRARPTAVRLVEGARPTLRPGCLRGRFKWGRWASWRLRQLPVVIPRSGERALGVPACGSSRMGGNLAGWSPVRHPELRPEPVEGLRRVRARDGVPKLVPLTTGTLNEFAAHHRVLHPQAGTRGSGRRIGTACRAPGKREEAAALPERALSTSFVGTRAQNGRKIPLQRLRMTNRWHSTASFYGEVTAASIISCSCASSTPSAMACSTSPFDAVLLPSSACATALFAYASPQSGLSLIASE
jgi:hypothetical protein